MAKKYAGEECLDAVSACVQVLGAGGLLPAQGMARRLLAAKALCFADGTTEMMNERIAAGLASQFATARAQAASTADAGAGGAPGGPCRALKLTQGEDGATQARLEEIDHQRQGRDGRATQRQVLRRATRRGQRGHAGAIQARSFILMEAYPR